MRAAALALFALACGPLADGQPPCDVATYAAIMADCGPRVHECEGRAGPCEALTECEGRLREREDRCLR